MWMHLLQKEDLARLYRLFQRVPKGLDPVADTFKRHVEAEGMKLVKEATEAMEAKKEKDASERPDWGTSAAAQPAFKHQSDRLSLGSIQLVLCQRQHVR